MLNEEQLKTIVEELSKQQKFQRGAWAKVNEIARQYAQMKLHGSYVENGSLHTISFSDRDRYTEMFKDNLLRAVEKAFLEDALTGALLVT